MIHELSRIEQSAKEQIKKAASVEDIERSRLQYVGRKGALSLLLRSIKNLPQQEKKEVLRHQKYKA